MYIVSLLINYEGFKIFFNLFRNNIVIRIFILTTRDLNVNLIYREMI
ncbi:hypothetical protein ADOKEBJH_00151 [Clostridioides phage AR1086-1]|nr:hypothetical protein ADOKEBJH_00151 [Clostridioides phage AR1086-1]